MFPIINVLDVTLHLFQEEKAISDRINMRAETKKQMMTDQEQPWPSVEEDTKCLLTVHDRLTAIGAHSAESRAGEILHGLVCMLLSVVMMIDSCT